MLGADTDLDDLDEEINSYEDSEINISIEKS